MAGNSTSSPTQKASLPLANIIYLVWSDLLSLIGLVGYLFVSYIILKYKKRHFSNSFFTLALSLALSDVTTLFLNFAYVTPSIIFGDQMPMFYVVCGGFVNLWVVFSSVLHMVAISFNRLAAVTMLQTYQTFFTARKLVIIIGFCYVFSLITALIVFSCGCVFSVPDRMAWKYTCAVEESDRCVKFAMRFVQVESSLIFVITFVVYMAIVIRLHKMDRSNQSERQRREMRRERSLVFQFGMVCVIYFVYLTIFWFIFLAKNDFTKYAGQWILGSFALFHCCLNPFLYMTFGSEIKLVMSGNSVGIASNGAAPTATAPSINL